jgi:hypothetical protein
MNIEDLKMNTIEVTKSAVNGQVYTVLDYNEYAKHSEDYANSTDIGIRAKMGDTDIVLPFKGKYNGNPISPGVYDAGAVDFFKFPDPVLKEKYVPIKTTTTSNIMNIQELIRNGEATRRLDEPFITTPDNITNIPIHPNDQPEMKCLKMALNAKNIDFDKYSGRFGDNFPNDKRQLKNHGATLNIIKRFCENCDMEALLILRDSSPDVPNPMKTEITVSLTKDTVPVEDIPDTEDGYDTDDYNESEY